MYRPGAAFTMYVTLGFAALAGLALASCRGAASDRQPISKESTIRQPSSAAQLVWREPLEVAVGPAFAGPWRMNESEFRYVDDPTVALRADGAAVVAWVDNQSKDVLLQVFEPNGTTTPTRPVNVSRTPDVFSWLPRVVIDLRGGVCVLWQEIVFSGGSHGGEIFFSRSDDGGTSFSPPTNLSNSTGGDGKGRLSKEHWDNGSLDLALGGGGELLAAWTEYDGALWFSRSSDGRTFSAPLKVAGDSQQPARGPALAASEALVYLAWTVGEDPGADIRLASSRDRGQSFEAARVVSNTAGRSDAPKIAVDRQNVLHLVHSESERGRPGNSHVRYLRLRATDSAFERPRTISAFRSRQDGASFPSLSLGPAGHVYVVWQHHPAAEELSRGLGFASSQDGGTTFGAPTLVAGTNDPALGVNGSRQGKLMRLLAANERGAVAVVSSSFEAEQRSRIRLLRAQSSSSAR